MSTFDKRCNLGIIAYIVTKKPNIGRTAMMKLIYIMQDVFNIKLGYNYEIYTYGPYSTEVLDDLDLAEDKKVLTSAKTQYGYHFNCAENTDVAIKSVQEFIQSNQENIDKVIECFADRTAKELELSATIIYVYKSLEASKKTVIAKVHDIKPHFDLSTIEEEYARLESINIIRAA